MFDFDLAAKRIALRPARPRDSARLLVVRRSEIADHQVHDLPELIDRATPSCSTIPASSRLSSKGDEARLGSAPPCTSARGRATGARSSATPGGPGQATPRFAGGVAASVVDKRATVGTSSRLQGDEPVELLLGRAGRMPLPPYIAGRREADERDARDYQTMFAREAGAVAAPPRRFISRRG